jgi:nucleotide-binding universal stress UspA family protein
MKVIMVPVADRPECKVALEVAFALAADLNSNIVGCHLRPHREESQKPSSARLALTMADTELPEEDEAAVRLNSDSARRLFRDVAEQQKTPMARKPRRAGHPLAYWNEMVGTPELLLGIIGPTADCIVLSRPKPRGSGPARAFLLAALMDSGKPLLVLPQERVKRMGKRILIAWNQGVQAASAMTAALPLLARADEVHIVCCGREEMPGPKMKHAQNYLLHWGIESMLHTARGRDPAAEILETYRAAGCDLLVMGAYSRSHLRERILGGVTHHMLVATDIPVFALHI